MRTIRSRSERSRGPLHECKTLQDLGRSLYFTPRETVIFGYLFDLADTDDDELVGGQDGGHALLGRARLPSETLERLWSEAGGGSPDEGLTRPQWFVLVALVALAQAGLPCTLRDLVTTCDVIPAVRPSSGGGGGGSGGASPSHLPPAQAFQNQAQMQPNNGRPRPIPDFFLDGGVPPPPLIAATASGESPSMRRSGSDKAVSSVRRGSGSGKKGARGRGGQKGGGYGYGGGGRHGGWEWEHEEGTGDTDGVGEGEGDDGYQLEVTVYSHRVVGEGYGSHTEYTVLANASLPRFARREMEVARRFSDFRWLHGCFRAIPGVLPPPLPPSKWAGSSSRDFVAERMKGLQRYMTRVAQHPILRRQYALQVFLEGTPRGLRAAKALLPARIPGISGGGSSNGVAWGDTFSPSMAGGGGTPSSPALSSSPGTPPADESGGIVRRRFSLGGADDVYVPGAGVMVNLRQGQRRSISFGASSDESLSAGGGAGGGGWAGAGPGGGVMTTTGAPWPLSVVANVGYEAYGNYVSTSVSTSLTSIKGVFGAVKTKARSVVGLVAGPAPISVETDPLYEAEVSRIEDLVAPVSGGMKIMESAAVLKRGVGYEMSRLGHYLTQVASLEDTDGLSRGSVSAEGSLLDPERVVGTRKHAGGGDGALEGDSGSVEGMRVGGVGWAKAEQVLGQRMERVATAWLEAIDQEESDFTDPLREQLGYLGSAKEVHRSRGRAIDELQAANGSLQRNKQRLHAARAQGDAHAASVSMAKMDLAEDRMARSQTRAALIGKTFKSEAKRFHKCRQAEGVAGVLELAKAQAAFSRKANATWKQVLEDINPTDDELRESQQRVQLPRREARIGEGRGRTGRALGGWLGASATSGVVSGGASPAGAGAGAGVGGGSSQNAPRVETRVDMGIGRGNMAAVENGHVVYEGGAVGGRSGDDGGGRSVSGDHGGISYPRSNGVYSSGAAASPAAAPVPAHEGNRRGLSNGPVGTVGVLSRAKGERGGDGGSGALGSDGRGTDVSAPSLGVGVGPAPGAASAWGQEEQGVANQEQGDEGEGIQEVMSVQASVTPRTRVGVDSPPLKDDWEALEQPPSFSELAEGAKADRENEGTGDVATAFATGEPLLSMRASSTYDEEGFYSAKRVASDLDGDTPVFAPGAGHDGGIVISRGSSSRARRASKLEAANSCTGIDTGETEGEGKDSAEFKTSREASLSGEDDEAMAEQLDFVSLDVPDSPSVEFQSVGKSKENRKIVSLDAAIDSEGEKCDAGVKDGPAPPSEDAVGRPAVVLSLMESLEALSSSGPDSALEACGESDTERGERTGSRSGVGQNLGKRIPAEPQSLPSVVTPAVSAPVTTTMSKKKKKKEAKKRAAAAAAAAAAVATPKAGDETTKGGCKADSGSDGAESKSATSDDAGTGSGKNGSEQSVCGSDPADSDASGSRGVGTVSAATMVARLSGSPNPPMDRDGGGQGGGGSSNDSRSAGGGGGAGADVGLRKIVPNGGSGGVSRGRVKS